MLRSGRRRDAAPVSPFEGPSDQTGLALETHLLRMAQELAEAMLALRPSSDDENGPGIWTAYDRLHRAMNDAAALYQRAGPGGPPSAARLGRSDSGVELSVGIPPPAAADLSASCDRAASADRCGRKWAHPGEAVTSSR